MIDTTLVTSLYVAQTPSFIVELPCQHPKAAWYRFEQCDPFVVLLLPPVVVCFHEKPVLLSVAAENWPTSTVIKTYTLRIKLSISSSSLTVAIASTVTPDLISL